MSDDSWEVGIGDRVEFDADLNWKGEGVCNGKPITNYFKHPARSMTYYPVFTEKNDGKETATLMVAETNIKWVEPKNNPLTAFFHK